MRRDRRRCLICGGTKMVEAVDNTGQQYLGCACCVVVLPPATALAGETARCGEAAEDDRRGGKESEGPP
jgi:hypothetical protein